MGKVLVVTNGVATPRPSFLSAFFSGSVELTPQGGNVFKVSGDTRLTLPNRTRQISLYCETPSPAVIEISVGGANDFKGVKLVPGENITIETRFKTAGIDKLVDTLLWLNLFPDTPSYNAYKTQIGNYTDMGPSGWGDNDYYRFLCAAAKALISGKALPSGSGVGEDSIFYKAECEKAIAGIRADLEDKLSKCLAEGKLTKEVLAKLTADTAKQIDKLTNDLNTCDVERTKLENLRDKLNEELRKLTSELATCRAGTGAAEDVAAKLLDCQKKLAACQGALDGKADELEKCLRANTSARDELERCRINSEKIKTDAEKALNELKDKLAAKPSGSIAVPGAPLLINNYVQTQRDIDSPEWWNQMWAWGEDNRWLVMALAAFVIIILFWLK